MTFTRDNFKIIPKYNKDPKLLMVTYQVSCRYNNKNKLITGEFNTELEAEQAIKKYIKFLNEVLEERGLTNENKSTD